MTVDFPAGHGPVPTLAGMPDLDEKTITEAVLRAGSHGSDERLGTVLGALVRHLHDFVREVSLTEAEWAAAIGFLTRTGQLCTPDRQEFILLSDVLGVTMLVDAVAHRRSPTATENSVLGPFFREHRPSFEAGADISGGLPGTPLSVQLTVVDTDGAPVPGAAVDVWHADSAGHYDSDVVGLEGAAMRGLFHTSADGRTSFTTISPAPYPIPDDGPVGSLMRASGRSVMRPGHLHVRIEAPGFSTLTTMLFREDDPYLENDPVFGVKGSLVARYETHEQGEALRHSFVLDRA
ncbi:intradiol ring-cleavage dioxygenase [Pseudonocardia yuanmonensis]|uniref:Intradiol ring-cleavage dioxygenase n=2 Tax=Pseudonocardia yuanmonensis TaxID=1095914 RepID=A0ABP8WP10_9PSEU